MKCHQECSRPSAGKETKAAKPAAATAGTTLGARVSALLTLDTPLAASSCGAAGSKSAALPAACPHPPTLEGRRVAGEVVAHSVKGSRIVGRRILALGWIVARCGDGG